MIAADMIFSKIQLEKGLQLDNNYIAGLQQRNAVLITALTVCTSVCSSIICQYTLFLFRANTVAVSGIHIYYCRYLQYRQRAGRPGYCSWGGGSAPCRPVDQLRNFLAITLAQGASFSKDYTLLGVGARMDTRPLDIEQDGGANHDIFRYTYGATAK